MVEINRSLEWSVRGLRVDIATEPEDIDQRQELEEFWRKLHIALDGRQHAALVQLVSEEYWFRLYSKSFDPEISRLFTSHFSLEASIDQLRGEVRVVPDVSSIVIHGVLVISACVQVDLSLASPEAETRFVELMKDDWCYVWDMATLSGPESFPHQEYLSDGYSLRLLDQQREILCFSS